MGTCVSLIGCNPDKFETTARTGYSPESSRRTSRLEIEATKQLILQWHRRSTRATGV
jgi:hypothetical protein